jgi:type II secretory pathway pseudopilin PulG
VRRARSGAPASLKKDLERPDNCGVGRGFGLVVVLCSLAIVAILMAINLGQTGPTSKTAKSAEAEGIAAVGAANFTQAGTELEAYRAEHETYAGAVLPPAFGVTLVRADATTYCLQAGVAGSVQHFVGPAGPASAGPC